MGDFEGFPKGGAAFFTELAKKQDRDWFKANKERYEALWQAPMEALLSDVQAGLARTFPDVEGAKPKVMRIYRDTRFSKDKTPFKTNIGATLALTASPGAPALYVHADAKRHFVACGSWQMEPEKLTQFREAIAEPDGEVFAKELKKLLAKGYDVHSHDALKRVPQGFDPEHPRADLLRQKGFALGYPAVPAGLPGKPEYVAWIVAQSRAAAKVLDWLESALA